MGPLFSLVLLAMLAPLTTGFVFVIARFFLPARDALILAALMVVAGGIGCFLGMLAQTLMIRNADDASGAEIARFFVLALTSGAVSALGVLGLFLRWRASRARKLSAQTFD
ncbi:MAG: hypothetical protein J7515_18715 [Caulobacter sp.]|nr:hypothetical protein [Caulobacter sp.]